MTPPNLYPELPTVSYKRTSVSMDEVVAYLKRQPYIDTVRAMAYVIFRNESGNGKSGVNGNYIGAQADHSRWPAKWDKSILGTTVKVENMTGEARRFLVFKDWTVSIDFLIDRVMARGLYMLGTAKPISGLKIKSETDLARAYWKEWVEGDKKSEPSKEFIDDFVSMYKQGLNLLK